MSRDPKVSQFHVYSPCLNVCLAEFFIFIDSLLQKYYYILGAFNKKRLLVRAFFEYIVKMMYIDVKIVKHRNYY